ncbi:MAG: cache domain-containing protein [Candidatus Tectomicrobia bacterium]|nr:cache domain-containing protein [Candidatus Tectomicrobia bacterium]
MPRKRLYFLLFLLIGLINCMVTAYLAYHFMQSVKETQDASFQLARNNANQISKKVNHELLRMRALVDRFAEDLTQGIVKPHQVRDRIRNNIKDFPEIFGYGLAYARGVYQPDKLYAPYYKKNKKGKFEFVHVEDQYNYTDDSVSNAAWYREALSAPNGVHWTKPYFGEATQVWFIDYMALFYEDDRRETIHGVVYADHTLETLTDLVQSIDVGEEGFSYILSETGDYIAHPSAAMIQKSILERADELKSSELREIGARAMRGETFHVESTAPITGRPTWTFHRPLDTGWSLGLVFDRTIGQKRPHAFVRPFIGLLLSTIPLLTVFAALLFRFGRSLEFGLWGISITVSLLFALNIILLWYVSIHYPHRDPSQHVLVSRARVDKNLAQVETTFTRKKLALPVRIPTGVVLETIDLSTTTKSMISGYIWQKYPLNLPDDIARGILLPDVVDEHEIEELHRVQEKEHELIVWFFRTPLRQHPTVEIFPLDEGTIQLQIWPRTLSPQIVLVPDLDGYEFMFPSQRPGLVDTLVLKNWRVEKTFFSYRYDHYHANFGSRTLIREREIPDLYFNVVVQRSILSPVIAYAVPMFVIAALLFATLIIKAGSSFNILGHTASLFFVLAISQVALRSYLAVPQVVYLEYGYILLYVAILCISVNSILYTSAFHLPIIQHRNNLWPKLLYWPILLGAFLWISLVFLMPPPVQGV